LNSRNKLAQRVFDDIFRHWNEEAGGGLVNRPGFVGGHLV
jgi:hypothetical protein